MTAVETSYRMLCGILFLFFLCCSAQALDVQGYEGGTVELPLSSFPEFVGSKDLYLEIIHAGGRDPTQVLKWTTRTWLATATVFLPQFEGRMSLLRGPGHPGRPHVVEIRNTKPSDAVTDSYFQFRQDGAQGQRMDLSIAAITVTGSPNPATVGQQVTLTCSVAKGSPDSFTWTHVDTGQTIPGTRDAQGNLYTASFTVGPNSAGSYVCNVSGSIGQGQKSIDLQIVSTMATTTTTPSLTSRKTTALSTSASILASSLSEETFSATQTTSATTSQILAVKPGVQESNSSHKESQSFGTAAIIACVLGGLVLVLMIAVACFWKRRKKSTSEENVTVVNGNGGQAQQEMILRHINECDAGTRSPIDPHQLSLPIQVSSICSTYEEEQNTINSRKPLLAKKRPKLHINTDCSNAELDNHTRARSASTQTPVDSPSEQVYHLNEGTSFNGEATAILPSDENTDPKAASSARPFDRGTGQGSPLSNRRRFMDASRSVSLDESTATEPHSLRSGHLNSRNCPQLEDMISYDARSEQTQNGLPANPTARPSSEQNKKLHHPNKAAPYKESTQLKGGFRASMETMMEDTMEEEDGGGQVSNQEGPRVDVSDLRAMSLNGNELATTIDQMIRKVLADVGNLDIPYRKFSELCLQLYNTQNNWKVLADRLGLTNGDILLIDNCSSQHHLPAAEIVLRHWQRTSRHDRTTGPPCNLQNLRTILQDMGREDLVSILGK